MERYMSLEARVLMNKLLRIFSCAAIMVALILIFMSPQPTAAQSTIYVDAANDTGPWNGTQVNPYRTIQDGISAASSGTTVRVAEGRYTERISINKEVYLLGGHSSVTWDRNSEVNLTTIDGGGLDRVVYLDYNSSGTAIDGFDITGGSVSGRGGGIFVEEPSNIIIKNNRIYGNTATYGGGIAVLTGFAHIEDNQIYDNAADTGGGIDLFVTSSIINSNDIWGNNSDNGAGIHIYEGQPDFNQNIIRNNIGHGISGAETILSIFDSIISGNTGDGIHGFGENGGTVSRCWVIKNSSWGINGGGFQIENCVVADNDAGGIWHWGSVSGKIVNSTIANNKVGGGIRAEVSTEILNSILWGNSLEDLPYGTTTAGYSDIGTGITTGEGNITLDPMFMDVSTGDYRVRYGSPCIDSATDVGAPANDINQDVRPQDGDGVSPLLHDMGAFEKRYPKPPIAYVDVVSATSVTEGEEVSFSGRGVDTDGSIVAFHWRSDKDGELSTSASFTMSSLTIGTHTIYFHVGDNDGLWSEEVTRTVTIEPKATRINWPIVIGTVAGVIGSLVAVMSFIMQMRKRGRVS